MNEDCLKLTTYFGERQRVGRRLLVDELLDLYGREQVAASIVLRGIEGFGLKHHLRTDASLTLSEDLSAIAVAVDTRARIEPLAEQVAQLSGNGIVTLERARMESGDLSALSLPAELHEATKLTVYVGRQERTQGRPAYVAICELLRRRGIAGASSLLGVDGTLRGDRQRARFFGRNVDVPMMIIAVGSGDEIGRLLPELGGLLRAPLVTLERVRICKRDGDLVERPHLLPSIDESGASVWQKLMIYTSEAQLHHRHPIHRELTRRLRGSGASGSTTLRGVWGFHGNHAPHGDRTFQLGRHVPVLTIVVDSPVGIARSFDIIDDVTAQHGLVTSEMVPAMRVSSGAHGRGDLRLARHMF